MFFSFTGVTSFLVVISFPGCRAITTIISDLYCAFYCVNMFKYASQASTELTVERLGRPLQRLTNILYISNTLS